MFNRRTQRNLSTTSYEVIKEIEIGIELENMDDIYYYRSNKKQKEKRPPGRSKKNILVEKQRNQMKCFLKSLKIIKEEIINLIINNYK